MNLTRSDLVLGVDGFHAERAALVQMHPSAASSLVSAGVGWDVSQGQVPQLHLWAKQYLWECQLQLTVHHEQEGKGACAMTHPHTLNGDTRCLTPMALLIRFLPW